MFSYNIFLLILLIHRLKTIHQYCCSKIKLYDHSESGIKTKDIKGESR